MPTMNLSSCSMYAVKARDNKWCKHLQLWLNDLGMNLPCMWTESLSKKGAGIISQMLPQHPVIIRKDHCEERRCPDNPCGSISSIHRGHSILKRQTWACMGQSVWIMCCPGNSAKGLLLDVFTLLSSARRLPVLPKILHNCRRTQNEEAACYVKGVFPWGKKK